MTKKKQRITDPERMFTCNICGTIVAESKLRDELTGHAPAADSAIDDPYQFFTPAPPSINLPEDADHNTKATIIGEYILFVTADVDQDCGNPLEDCDGMGHIYSLSSRHINHKDIDEVREILESDPDSVALSYYEHGNSLWFVMGDEPVGVEFQWDGRRFAGIWVPDDCCRESYTEKDGDRREWFVKQAECACKEYTAWANGECYGYNVSLYKLRRDDDGEPYDQEDDYRRNTPVEEDSCWGFIGWDYFETEMKDAAERVAKEAK